MCQRMVHAGVHQIEHRSGSILCTAHTYRVCCGTGNLDNSYMYENYYGVKKDKMIRTHGHDPHMLRARTVHI